MIADRGRTGAYAEAIRASVTPDSVVLDIGTGAGVLALLACQAGARRVYAVEPDGIIQVARENAVRNGYADRFTFIEAFSTAIDLPEPVDIILSGLHGTPPFFAGSMASILDARDRFLKPGGVLIPMRDTVSVAVVTMPEVYTRIVAPWESHFDLEWSAGQAYAVCTAKGMGYTTRELLVEPKVWCTLDYQDLQGPSAKGSANWTIADAGTGHGLLMWFDSETAPRCGFSNSPLSGERHIVGNCFFPWSEPRDLEPGDRVRVEIRADVVGGDYMWSWNTDIRGPGRGDSMLAQYRQSDLQGALLTPDWLRRSDAAFVPTPTPQAHVDRMTLGLLGEGLTLREIARRVADHYPDRFATWQEALAPVSDLSRRYSR